MANIKLPKSKEEKKAADFVDLAFRDSVDPRNAWLQQSHGLLESYKGRYWRIGDNNHHNKFTFNSFFNIVNTIMPALIFRQPVLEVKARRSRFIKEKKNGKTTFVDALEAARKVKGAINHLYRVNATLEEDKKATFDALFYGVGICKNGYSFETLSTPDEDIVIKDTPFRQRVDPRMFGWHPLATGTDDSTFLIHRVVVSRGKLKDMGVKNFDAVEADLPQHIKHKIEINGIDANDFVTLNEVHDQENDKIYLFGGKDRQLLDKTERKYKFKGSDFDILKLAGSNDDFLGISPMFMVEDIARVINEVLTLMVEHYRKFPSQIFIEEGAADEIQLEAIRSGEQGSIHIVNDISKIQITNPTSMGVDYNTIANLMQVAMDRILGLPGFNSLSGTQSRRSATEAAAVAGGANARVNHLVHIVKSFVLAGVRKQSSLQAQFLDSESYIETDPELDIGSLSFDKKDLKPVLDGDMEFDLDVDELTASDESQITAFNNTMNILGAHEAFAPVLAPIDQKKLGRWIFKKHGLNYDQFTKEGVDTSPGYTPERENDLARTDQPMPAPQAGEDYAEHIKSHVSNMLDKGESQQIFEHLATTIVLAIRDQANPDKIKEALGKLAPLYDRLQAQFQSQGQGGGLAAQQAGPPGSGTTTGPAGPGQQTSPIG